MAANGRHRDGRAGRDYGRASQRPGNKSSGVSKRRKKRRRNIFFRPLVYLLMIAAMLLGISVFFKVSHITVEGNSKYSTEEIIAVTEIEKGDSLFFINSSITTGRLFKTLPYIDEAKIKRKLPDTIIISVEESYPLASVTVSGNYYIIDKNCKVLEKTDYSGSIGTIAIQGIEPILPTVGEKLDLSKKDSLKIGYLTELLGLIMDKQLQNEIKTLDATSIANFTFRYMDRFTVELGKQDRLKYKLDRLDRVLEYITAGETGTILINNGREPRFIPD